MRKITVEQLRKLNACADAVKWFADAYPDGAEITVETLATVPNRRWIVWLASRLNPSLGWVWAGIAFRHAARRNPTLAQYADNVTADNWREARNTAYAADDAAYADAAVAWDEMITIASQFLLE